MGIRYRAPLAIALVACVVLSSWSGVAAVVAPAAAPAPAGSAVGPAPDTLPPSSFSSGLNASQVLGKSDFTSSPALANASTLCNANSATFDAHGDLWVADYCSNRVLEFVPPFSSQMRATLVLGQPNMTANGAGTSARSFYQPSALAFDSGGDLWVVDTFNNRVLEFVPPFTSGMAASLVVGQSSFTSSLGGSGSTQLDGPDAVTFDAYGDLWVSEFINNRITEFTPPFSNGMAASTVLGQPGFGESGIGTGPARLHGPFGAVFNASGALWVADTNNNRILAFLPPFVSGESATFVLGQPNFTADQPSVGPRGFYGPNYLSFDAQGDLWVGDTNNNRVLEFTAPITALSSAALVLGQPNDTGRLAHTSATGMSNPEQALLGPGGLLYVVEFSNSRVLAFAPPFVNGSAAELVIGQASFDTSSTAPTAASLGRSTQSVYDAAGDLWVLDTYSNRVLEFPAPVTIGESATVVLGQPSLNDSLNGQSASNLFLPQGLAFAPDGALWVSDTYNDRVLEFLPPFTTGMSASLVLGQPNFTSSAPGTTDRSLALPGGIAFDAAGDLWVVDSLNSRVVEFRPPFSTYEAASTVIGQPNFTSFLPGTSPQQLFFPSDVAFDANGTLYVSDTDNNRVLAFPPPLTTYEAANAVLGQTNLYSGGNGSGPSGLTHPTGVAVDPRGAVWVADTLNNRVLRYALPVVDGEAADVVLGQGNLFGASAGTTSSALRYPIGVTVDPVSGGLWVGDYGNSRLLFFPGDAIAVATGSVTFTGGVGAINQRPFTGVQLNFTDVQGLAAATVVTQRLAGAPVGVTPTGFANTTYFDVAAFPVASSGVAQTCLTVPGVTVHPELDYWNGASWVEAGSIGVDNSTECGTIPLTALVGTPIALSVAGPSSPPSSASLSLFVYATIAFIVVVAGLILFNIRRQRKASAARPPEPSDSGPLPASRPPGPPPPAPPGS